MTDREPQFPILFSDGRTRCVSQQFIWTFWMGVWDSVVYLRHSLEGYLKDCETKASAQKMISELDEFFHDNPDLRIPDEYIEKLGNEFGWPDWYKSLVRK